MCTAFLPHKETPPMASASASEGPHLPPLVLPQTLILHLRCRTHTYAISYSPTPPSPKRQQSTREKEPHHFLLFSGLNNLISQSF